MIYVPEVIATVLSENSQWFHGFDEQYFRNTFWSARRSLGSILSFIYIFYWCLIRSNDYKSYFKISKLLNDLGKKDEAIEMLQNLVKNKPDYYEASIQLGELLCEQERFKEAANVYNAALISGLDIVEVHNHTYPSHYVAKGRDAAVSYGYISSIICQNIISTQNEDAASVLPST